MIRNITKPFFLIITILSSQLLFGQTVQIGATSYNTIAEAIAAAVDGDVIDITGVHTEVVSIPKSITLRGTDPKTDIIQAAASMDAATARVLSIANEAGVTGDLNVTVENLGIRYGNAAENGGGIFVDKVTGMATLKNLIIEQSTTAKNGGGISIAGSKAQVIGCVVMNNNSALDGGGIILAPNNAAGIDTDVDILGSLIDSNTGRNGGGIYINGNKDFGNNYLIDVYVENTTISNNSAFSPATGAGGGGIWSRCALWTGDNTTGNVTLSLVHTTMYNNLHTSTLKNGIQFTSTPAEALTNFSIYNSIVVTEEDLTEKALNFANSNTTEAINNILGGLNGLPEILADSTMNANRNNSNGKLASFAGLATSLTNEGGNVNVFAMTEEANAFNYCKVATGITLPTTDAVGSTRDALPDAGAFELLVAPAVVTAIEDQILQTGFGSVSIDLSTIFADKNADALTYSAALADEGIVSIAFDGNNMTITEVGLGTTTVTITADDGTGRMVSDDFTVLISENGVPAIDAPLENVSYEFGFQSATIDLANRFTDSDGDPITLSVAVLDESVVTAAMNGTVLTITEVASGTTTITVTADDGNGGVASADFQVVVLPAPLGWESELEVSVYPNPASESLQITGLDLTNISGIQLLDLSGRKHAASFTTGAESMLIDIRQLEAGQYILVIEQPGQKQLVQRFIKSDF